MSLKFIFGASGSGKSEALYREIIECSLAEPDRKIFMIVPDQFTMQTQMDLVKRHPKRGIMNIDVLSFGRLSHRIFEETGGPSEPVLDDTGKSLVLRRVAQELSGELTAIGSNLKKNGYIHEVKSAISEFMQYGIGVDEVGRLADYAKVKKALHYKLKDLQVLYQGFHEYTRGRFSTTEETLGILKGLLSGSELIRDSVVAFDSFTGFTPVQNQVIGELLRLCGRVIVTVLIDTRENPYETDGEQRLFYLSKKTAVSLRRLAEEAGTALEKDVFLKGDCPRFIGNGELSHLERQLFRYPAAAYEERVMGIRIVEASNPKEEAVRTAREIRRLTREKGMSYRDVAVIAGDLSSYEAYVEEAFEAQGIPVFIDRTNGIALNPFIEYIRSALMTVKKNFSYEAVFHFLRSGLCSVGAEETDRLENYVLAAGIRGRRAWSAPFTKRGGRRGRECGPEALEEYNRLRRQVMDELSPLLGRPETAEEHARALYDFLVRSRTAQKLDGYAKRFEREGELSKAREYAQIYRLVMELLDQICALLAGEKMELSEFADILDAGFGEIQVGTIPQSVDKVVVGDIERTRLKEIRALFFIGVNDGNIPAGNTAGGILSDIDREFLSGSELELAPTPRQKMYIQRLYLYMNMTKPSDILTLSYCRSTSDGKAKKPSYLIGQMQKLFPFLTVEQDMTDVSEMQIESAQDALPVLAGELREYAAGRLNEEEERAFFALYGCFLGMEAYGGLAARLKDRAFARYEGEGLGREIAGLLYGRVLENSVSRLEQFAACAYAHFLKYGLTLKERETYSFEDVDMGNVFHGVLEEFAAKLAERGLTWFDFTREQGKELVESALSAYAASYGETVLFSSARNEYAVTRMRRILNRTVDTLQYQLKKGAFTPRGFEVSFEVLKSLDGVEVSLEEGEKMRLRGRIDRIDTAETEEKVYVKVIDYKSGGRSFDIVSLYYGLQLQLVAYLNAACEQCGKEYPGREIAPAAVLYYHVSDPMIRIDGEEPPEEEISRRLRQELCMTGVVNEAEEALTLLDRDFAGRSDVIPVQRKKDGSLSARSSAASGGQLQKISDYVNQKIAEIGRAVLDGEIQRSPYKKGQSSACAFCAYKTACGFDRKMEGCVLRELTLSGDEAMERICGEKKEEERDGNQLYGTTEAGN